MRLPIIKSITISAVIFSAVFQCNAAEKEDIVETLLNLSLEELLKAEVSGVSRKKESLDFAPGIATVISQRQIRKLGAKNITDVLKTIPGLFTFNNYFNLTDQFSIRGNLAEDYNTKILFLINGHPSYHTLNTTFFSDMIPLDAVERLEVVRGPVSVLYGTNALTGVINIITKTEKDSRTHAALERGSHGTTIVKLDSQLNSENNSLFFAFEAKSTDGYAQKILADEDDSFFSFKENEEVYSGNGGDISLGEEHTSLFAQLNNGNFTVDLSLFAQDREQKQGISPSLYFRGSPFEIDIAALDFRYNYLLNENSKLRFVARYDSYRYDYTVGNYQELDVGLADSSREATGSWRGKKFGVEAIFDYHDQYWELIAGIMHDQYHGDRVSFETGETSSYWFAPEITGINANFELIPTDTDNSDSALYANTKYQFNQNTNGVLGLRYTDNEQSGSHFDYRIGSIAALNSSTTLKILWGTAYRSANLNEYNVSATPVIKGNAQLDFETLQGLDVALVYKGDRYALNVSYFWNETDNEITTRPIIDPEVGFEVPTYTNVEGKRTQGLEYDFSYIISGNTQFYIRGSELFKVTDRETGADIQGETIRSIHASGISMQFNDQFSLNINSIYNGEWNGEGAYHLINVYSQYQLTQKIQLYLQAHNLFNTEYSYSIWQGNWESERLPSGDPRSVYLGLLYRWR
ncbi:TonB-dependent receptor [Aliikangiella sp. G2MR2-5]|uniref:TonB-dependent receptor n=1 Tax=Aliikangiella sp. G2MR2-5 TaxID=2788943 RepID=UPI0018A95EEA|nr:TonB-dependent receptor [Aliikangiella sp. G2MR2-5]